MTELSNAVTVLIARMESHPEDFNTTGFGKPKFRDVADALYGLAGLDKERAGSYWFLTDVDKEALIEAWKKYHRTRMEKEVMEKIFDDGAEERELEDAHKASMNAYTKKQAMAQQQAAQNSYPYLANQATAANQYGQYAINAAAQNSSSNTGLFGQAGSALQGIFK